MKSLKLILLGAATLLPTMAFATINEPMYHCPPIEDIKVDNNGWHTTWYYWESPVSEPRVNKPKVTFVEAEVKTSHGSDSKATKGYMLCVYSYMGTDQSGKEVNDLMMLKRNFKTGQMALANPEKWQFVPHATISGYGEWQCKASPAECGFISR